MLKFDARVYFKTPTRPKFIFGCESILLDTKTETYIFYIRVGLGLQGQLPIYKEVKIKHALVEYIKIKSINEENENEI